MSRFLIAIILILALYNCKQVGSSIENNIDSLTVDQTDANVIRFTTAADSNSPVYQLGYAIYHEIFQRLGYDFYAETFPTERALLLVNNGIFDGEGGRIVQVDEIAYPNVISSNEPIFTISLAAYCVGGAYKISGWNSFENYPNLSVGIVNGSIESSVELPHYIPTDKIVYVNNTEQGFMMLKAKRIDIFIDVLEYIQFLMEKHPEFKEMGISNAGIINTYKVYSFLNKKHEKIVPRMDSVLRDMKKSGDYIKLIQSVQQKSAS